MAVGYYYRLLESGDVNGERAFISSRAKRGHCNVRDGRNHHEGGKVVEEECHEEVS